MGQNGQLTINSGRADMNMDGVWERNGIKVKGPQEYHL